MAIVLPQLRGVRCVFVHASGIAGSEDHCYNDGQGSYDHVFAVNYLGHFLLVYRLLPLLTRSAPSRIVSISSMAHAFVKHPLFDLDSKSTDGISFCKKLVGYDASKLAMILHVKELTRILGGT
jgi:retinol dehydrogenase-12